MAKKKQTRPAPDLNETAFSIVQRATEEPKEKPRAPGKKRAAKKTERGTK